MTNPNEAVVGLMMIFFILLFFAGFITTAILYLCSLQKTLKYVPESKRVFPNWFIWMQLVPFANIVFGWIMIPFGIPDNLRNALSDNSAALKAIKTLKGVGFAMMILTTLLIFFNIIVRTMILMQSPHITQSLHDLMMLDLVALPFAIANIVLWIIYWVKVVDIRKYFNNTLMHS